MPDKTDCEKPLVTVIMNCYNSAQYLRKAIDSVIEQTYNNWELIFWDNQSTDESANIFKSYQDIRLKYFYAPEHTPLGTARKLAFEKANGQWVGILDCDDVWLPEKLELQVAKGIVSTNIGIVYSNYSIIDGNGRQKKEGTHSAEPYTGLVFNQIFKEDFTVCWPTVLFKMTAFRQIGTFESYKYLEDFDILLRFAEKFEFEYIDKKLASYRVHDGQSSVNYEKMLDEKIAIINKWKIKWIKGNEFTWERKKLISSAKAKAFSIAAKNAVYYGDSGTKLYLCSLKESITPIAFGGLLFSLFGSRFAAKAISFIRRLSGRSEYYQLL